MKKYKRVLTIAGSDSGGGAGIQADLKTFSALGCYGMSVITAITAQNTKEVRAIQPLNVDIIVSQINCVIEDIGVDVVKIGMLHSSEVISAVSERLRYYKINKIVLDPVMIAKSGDKLLEDSAIFTLKKMLIPQALVITPNLPEAAILLDVKDISVSEENCRQLLKLGIRAAVLKGGHDQNSGNLVDDYLVESDNNTIHKFSSARINTRNTHGSGCTFSSAIAAFLAHNYSLSQAVKLAKDYVSLAIAAGSEYQLGNNMSDNKNKTISHGALQHFYKFWS